MKLIYCPKCSDTVALTEWEKFCKCKASHGRYVDRKKAVISSDAVVWGVPSQSVFIHDGTDILYEDGTEYEMPSSAKLQFIVRLRRNGDEGERVFVKTFKTLKQFLRFYGKL